MQAIILAGGFGTRLQSVLNDVPKPMAPINAKPFLCYLLDYLKSQGISHIVLSLHHHAEKIKDYFKNEYQGVELSYVIEEEPLGTGGAIAFCLKQLPSDEPVFILNGDTFLKMNYVSMVQHHRSLNSDLTLALSPRDNCERYGRVVVEGNTITQFQEKGMIQPGLINAGVYLMSPRILSHFPQVSSFSFETDFLHKKVISLKPHAFIANDYFIDIGIPEDLARAQKEFNLELFLQ